RSQQPGDMKAGRSGYRPTFPPVQTDPHPWGTVMSKKFPRLFSPLALRSHTLKNRIVFGAHTANMAVEGLPGERHVAYYEERAIGGAALIVVKPIPVHAAAVLSRGNFRHGDDGVIPHFR